MNPVVSRNRRSGSGPRPRSLAGRRRRIAPEAAVALALLLPTWAHAEGWDRFPELMGLVFLVAIGCLVALALL